MTAADLQDPPPCSCRTQTEADSWSQSVSDPRQARCICVAVALVVGAAFEVPVFRLFSPSRGAGEVAFARHVAMYIAHVELGLPMQRVGEGFGRNRTTVAHACRRIEESRDSWQLDRLIVAARRQVLADWIQHDDGAAPAEQPVSARAGSRP